MLIPIGREDTIKHKRSWIALAFICLCILVFYTTYFSSELQNEKGLALLDSAADYYCSHPYLTLDARVEKEMPDSRRMTALETLYSQFELELNPDPETLSWEQAELDSMTRESFELIDSSDYRKFGYIPAAPTIVSIFTHVFIHVGWLHLVANMLCFFFLGSLLEREFGRIYFAIFIVLTPAFSALMHSAYNQDSLIPLVGASSLSAGIVGAFSIQYLHDKIALAPKKSLSFPAWTILPLWLAWEIFPAHPIDSAGAGGRYGPAYWAHAWGFLFGIASAFIIKYLNNEKLLTKQSAKTRTAAMDESVARKAADYLAREQNQEAWDLLWNELNSRPKNAAAASMLWNLALETRQTGRAAPVLANSAAELVEIGRAMEAYLLCHELFSSNKGKAVPLRIAVRLAELLAKEKQLEASRDIADRAAENISPKDSIGALLRLAKLTDAQSLILVAQALFSHKDLAADAKAKIDKLLAARNLKISPPQLPSPEQDKENQPSENENPADSHPRISAIKGKILGVSDGKLALDIDKRGEALLCFSKIKAMAAVKIDHLIGPSLVVDIFLDEPSADSPNPRCIRCEKSAIDPLETKYQTAQREKEALRIAAEALEKSGALPLPAKWSSDVESLCTYDSLRDYELAIFESK